MITFQTRPQSQVSAIQAALSKRYQRDTIQAGDTIYLSYGRNKTACELFVLGYAESTFPQLRQIVTMNRTGEIIRISQDASNISSVSRKAPLGWQMWALVGYWAQKKAGRFREVIRQLRCQVESIDSIIAAQHAIGWVHPQWEYQNRSVQEWNEAVLPENEKRIVYLEGRIAYYEQVSKLAYELAGVKI